MTLCSFQSFKSQTQKSPSELFPRADLLLMLKGRLSPGAGRPCPPLLRNSENARPHQSFQNQYFLSQKFLGFVKAMPADLAAEVARLLAATRLPNIPPSATRGFMTLPRYMDKMSRGLRDAASRGHNHRRTTRLYTRAGSSTVRITAELPRVEGRGTGVSNLGWIT